MHCKVNSICKMSPKSIVSIYFSFSFQSEVSSDSLFNFHLDPVLGAAVIVATSGLIGVIIGVFLVQKGLNRKRLLLFSGFGTAIAFLSLSLHFYDNETGKSQLYI